MFEEFSLVFATSHNIEILLESLKSEIVHLQPNYLGRRI